MSGCAALVSRGGKRRHSEVAGPPPLVPPRFVVDYEKSGGAGEDVDEGAGIVGIGRQSGRGFSHQADGSNGGLAAVGLVSGSLHRVVVDAGNLCGEDVRLKASRINEVVLKQLARFRSSVCVRRLGKSLNG